MHSQISPHFLFRVLNNMVAVVRVKREGIEPTIVQLSALMQYMLYETDYSSCPIFSHFSRIIYNFTFHIKMFYTYNS